MTEGMVFDVARNAMTIALQVSLPFLVLSLIAGLVVSIFQAVTQINEMTLSFIPKLVAIFITLIIAGPWMLTILLDYMRQMFTNIATMAG